VVTHAARPILLDLTLDQLGVALKQAGQPGYRAKQVFHWLHRRGVVDPEAMTDLPAGLRNSLAEQFTIHPLKHKRRRKAPTAASSSAGSRSMVRQWKLC